jgi:hypothetical protein
MSTGYPGIVHWRKSSHSSSQANCIEVAFPDAAVAIRDSKNREAGEVVVPAVAWTTLLDMIGEFPPDHVPRTVARTASIVSASPGSLSGR